MKKLYKLALLSAFLALPLAVSGCGSADPFVIKSIETLKQGDIDLMDDYDRMATKAGEPKLPKQYRDDKTGAHDDLIGYLNGAKPKTTVK